MNVFTQSNHVGPLFIVSENVVNTIFVNIAFAHFFLTSCSQYVKKVAIFNHNNL